MQTETSRGGPFAWRALAHRWFVEFNPLYLLSAALVLLGCNLCSRGLALRDGLAGPLGIALVAETYAFALILGAALLVRIGFRRPAVMLAMLAVVYQWDVTAHAETCAYLGRAGTWAAAVWVLCFSAKMAMLAWAFRIRFSRRLIAAAASGALGIAILPQMMSSWGASRRTDVVVLWLFTLVSLYAPGGLESRVPLDAWGETVVRRATRVVWAVSGVLVLFHAWLWWRDHDMHPGALVLVAPLVFVRAARRESRAWLIVAGTLGLLMVTLPVGFSLVASAAAIALASRAACRPAPEAHRLWMGAISSAYFAVWAIDWTGHGWPAHVLWLDAAFAIILIVVSLRQRERAWLLPVPAPYLHLAFASGLIPLPASAKAWGETAIATGFCLLGGCLLVSYRMRGEAGPRRDEQPSFSPGCSR